MRVRMFARIIYKYKAEVDPRLSNSILAEVSDLDLYMYYPLLSMMIRPTTLDDLDICKAGAPKKYTILIVIMAEVFMNQNYILKYELQPCPLAQASLLVSNLCLQAAVPASLPQKPTVLTSVQIVASPCLTMTHRLQKVFSM